MQRPLKIALALLLLIASGAMRAEPMSAREAFELPQPEPDAVIRYGELTRQFGELRLPEGEGPFGVAVIVHGGCWISDYDHGYMAAFAQAVTDLGLATWTIGYRRVGDPGGGWPNTFLDAGSAVDFLAELASSYPLDVERVLAIGHSAGGQLALWLAGRARLVESSPLFAHDPQPIAGVLALAAAADLEYLSERQTCDNAATRLMQGTPSERPRRYAEVSPAHRPPLDIPQAMVNGELDDTWSAPAESYFEAALAAGAPIQLQVMPDAGHFELVAPESPDWQVVRTMLVELIDRISPASP